MADVLSESFEALFGIAFAGFFDFVGVPAVAAITLSTFVLDTSFLALCGAAFMGLLAFAGVAAGRRLNPGTAFAGVDATFLGVAITVAAAVLPGPLNAAPIERVLGVTRVSAFSLPTSSFAACLVAASRSLFTCAGIGTLGRHRETPGVGSTLGGAT